MTRHDWRDQAACLDYDPEEWTDRGSLMAHRLCRICPVKAVCLSDAKAMDTRGVVRAGVYFAEQSRDEPEQVLCDRCEVRYARPKSRRDQAQMAPKYCAECRAEAHRDAKRKYDLKRKGDAARKAAEAERNRVYKARLKMRRAS